MPKCKRCNTNETLRESSLCVGCIANFGEAMIAAEDFVGAMHDPRLADRIFARCSLRFEDTGEADADYYKLVEITVVMPWVSAAEFPPDEYGPEAMLAFASFCKALVEGAAWSVETRVQ